MCFRVAENVAVRQHAKNSCLAAKTLKIVAEMLPKMTRLPINPSTTLLFLCL
jgi:hypothetical protein